MPYKRAAQECRHKKQLPGPNHSGLTFGTDRYELTTQWHIYFLP